MSVTAARVSVGTSPTLLTSTPSDSVGGAAMMVRNRDASASVFLGGATVTTAAGFELLAGESLPLDLDQGETVYGIASSGTVTCHVIQAGV